MQVKRVRQVHAQVYLSFEGAFLNLEDWLYIENILLFWSTKLSKLIQGLMEIVSIILSILFFYKFPILPHHAFIFILLKGEFEIITVLKSITWMRSTVPSFIISHCVFW